MDKEDSIMIDNLEERCRDLGRYMISHGCTIRQVAEAKRLSKSTVHKDLTERLPVYDRELYKEVRKQLGKNAAERHLRGGQATKKKYETMRFWGK